MDQDRPDSSQRPLQPQWQPSPSQPLPQQPYPQYPQFQPPVYPPPPKKRGLWKFFAIGCGALVALVVIIAVIAAAVSVGSSNSSTTNTSITSQATQAVQQSVQPLTQAPTPTPKPTQPPKWTTVQQFSGNGTKKTAIFTVPDDWKILWLCDPSSFYGGQYNLIVTVTASDNTPVDIAINTICKSGNTHDVTEEHQGGQVFLDVSSEGSWALQVQVLK